MRGYNLLNIVKESAQGYFNKLSDGKNNKLPLSLNFGSRHVAPYEQYVFINCVAISTCCPIPLHFHNS